MKNRKRQKKKEQLEARATEHLAEQLIYIPAAINDPHSFNPHWPYFSDEKWVCDKCGYEETPQSRTSIRFATITTDTGDMCPNCLIEFLNEHIPQLRKVNNNE